DEVREGFSKIPLLETDENAFRSAAHLPAESVLVSLEERDLRKAFAYLVDEISRAYNSDIGRGAYPRQPWRPIPERGQLFWMMKGLPGDTRHCRPIRWGECQSSEVPKGDEAVEGGIGQDPQVRPGRGWVLQNSVHVAGGQLQRRVTVRHLALEQY